MHSYMASTTPLYYGGDSLQLIRQSGQGQALLKEAGYDKGLPSPPSSRPARRMISRP